MSVLEGPSARVPGDEPPRGRLPAWLREKLFERRIVVVSGELDDALASETAAQLLALDAISDEPIDLVVDSRDGDLGAAFVLIDAIEIVRAKVRVQCRGRICGPVIGVVGAGDERRAAPHTRFRLAQPRDAFFGTPDEIESRSRSQQDLLWRLSARLAQVTGRPAEEIAEDMRRGLWLDAGEALDYGLIESITSDR